MNKWWIYDNLASSRRGLAFYFRALAISNLSYKRNISSTKKIPWILEGTTLTTLINNVGLIKDHNDPELVSVELSNGEPLVLTREFIEWFRGFTDAEGCFQIYEAAKGSSFGFTFGIWLHVDDIAVLEYIKDNLHMVVKKKI